MKMPKTRLRELFILLLFSCLFGCYPALREEAGRPEEAMRPIRFFLPTFRDDLPFESFMEAIENNKLYLEKLDPETEFKFGTRSVTCEQMLKSQEVFVNLIKDNPDMNGLNSQIKKQFQIHRANGRAGNKKVLFTGYFEPVYEGNLVPDEIFRYPIYHEPDDLIKIDLSLFHEKYKGQRIIARIEGKNVLPYYARRQIESEKALSGRNLEIAWLKDPVDVAFLHIQGSGRIRLPDGTSIMVGYQSANGRPYKSIGGYLLNNDLMTYEEMSMQSIRKYLFEHPEAVDEVLNHNPSYIFFNVLEGDPLGSINVPLTPGRSIALDARLFPKGAIAFISCQKPVVDNQGEIVGWEKFSRFMINQDTGGAIKGAGRADIFWGSGEYAEVAAGHQKHNGELFFLIKKEE